MVGGFLVQGCGVVGKGRGDVRQADVQNRIMGRGSMSAAVIGAEGFFAIIGAIAILND